jgi:hypothetical protein
MIHAAPMVIMSLFIVRIFPLSGDVLLVIGIIAQFQPIPATIVLIKRYKKSKLTPVSQPAS